MQLPNLSHIGNWEDEEFRSRIFDCHPSLSLILANDYQNTYRKSGKVAANSRLREFHQRLNWTFPGLKLTSEDTSIKSFAKLKAEALEDKVKATYKSKGFKAAKKVAETFLKQFKLEIPVKQLKSREPTNAEYMEAISKACGDSWWRRQIRTRQGRDLEQLLRELGQVSATHGGYVSGHGLTRRKQQRRRNAEALSMMEAENQHGEVFSLEELANKTVANKSIRKDELAARMAGFEQLAKEMGFTCKFPTLTTPSKYHCMIKKGGKCFRNPKFNNTTPREAQQYLSNVWAKVRAEWDRCEIRCFGLRIAEPHHDATPHWHMVLFFQPDQAAKAMAIFRKYALQEDGDEKGAQENRFKVVDIDPAKGSATGYVLKYISKNIDGSGIEGQVSDETGEFIDQACIRVDAWAALWGIRQFQQIGGASVSVWRELRKIKEEGRDNWQEMLPQKERLSEEQMEAFEEIRQAADQGEWSDYVELQGGATVKRKEQKLKPWRASTLKQTDNEKRIASLFGVVLQGAGEAVKGVVLEGKEVLSRFFQWTIREKRISKRSAGTAIPWTCVNNCTEPERGWAYG